MAPTSANSLRPYTVPKLLLPKSSRKFLSAAITGSNSVVGDSSQHADNNNADDKFELLTQKFKQIEAKYRDLVIENEKSCLELANEKTKVVQLERTLKFVRDNHETLKQLKEAYVGVEQYSNNDSEQQLLLAPLLPARKIVEIQEKGVQTWQGVLCKCCLDTENFRRQLDMEKKFNDDSIIITKNDMNQLMSTLSTLKNAVSNNWDDISFTNVSNKEQDNNVKDYITLLESENNCLKELLIQSPDLSDCTNGDNSDDNENNLV